MALTTRQAAADGAAGELALGLIGGYLAGGLSMLHVTRRAYRRRTAELERMVSEKDAAIAALRTARPPVILDEWGPLGTIPGLAEHLTRPTGVSMLDLTALAVDPARAYTPLPVAADTRGNAPDARLDS